MGDKNACDSFCNNIIYHIGGGSIVILTYMSVYESIVNGLYEPLTALETKMQLLLFVSVKI